MELGHFYKMQPIKIIKFNVRPCRNAFENKGYFLRFNFILVTFHSSLANSSLVTGYKRWISNCLWRMKIVSFSENLRLILRITQPLTEGRLLLKCVCLSVFRVSCISIYGKEVFIRCIFEQWSRSFEKGVWLIVWVYIQWTCYSNKETSATDLHILMVLNKHLTCHSFCFQLLRWQFLWQTWKIIWREWETR